MLDPIAAGAAFARDLLARHPEGDKSPGDALLAQGLRSLRCSDRLLEIERSIPGADPEQLFCLLFNLGPGRFKRLSVDMPDFAALSRADQHMFLLSAGDAAMEIIQ